MSDASRRSREPDDADDVDEELLEAPERGSAESCSTPARTASSTRCATRPRTSWPRRSSTCSRARSSASGRRSRTASTTTSTLPRALTPDDLAAIEARMRESVAADHPFVRRELPPDEGRAFFDRARASPSRSRSSTTSRTAAKSCGAPSPPMTHLRARAVHRPVPGAARRLDGQDRAVQAARPSPARTGAATRSGRCSSASTARSGRPRRSSTTTCGGARRRSKRDHRRLGVQLDLFSFHDVSPGSAFWHPKGQTLWRTLEGAMRELQARRGYQEI